jgi:hypothetical protein
MKQPYRWEIVAFDARGRRQEITVFNEVSSLVCALLAMANGNLPQLRPGRSVGQAHEVAQIMMSGLWR